MQVFRLQRARRGFTLVELLVAIGIITILATLALLVVPKFNANNAVVRAADQVSGWTVGARNRALRDKTPRGIHLVRDVNNPRWATSIEFVEQPEPVIPVDAAGNRLRILVTPSPNDSYVTINGFSDTSAVQVDDYVKLYGTNPPKFHRITAVNVAAGNMQLTVYPPVDYVKNGKNLSSDAYQIVRRWRPLAGENALQLPKGMHINLDFGYSETSSLAIQAVTTNGLEPVILFTPSGPVADTGGGKVILWVESDDGDGEPVLVVIYTRTGTVAQHPPGPYSVPRSASDDPYRYARDGKGSGL